MTIKEVLELVIDDLRKINVPVGLMEQIGLPINQSIGNLKACIEAINRDEKKPQEEAKKSSGDEVRLD